MPETAPKRFGILKVIAIAAILIAAVIIALPFILDVNQFRPQFESKLSSALGRDVNVANLKLSLLSGSLEVNDISIADNPDFSRAPFVTAGFLKVRVQLKPLIFSKDLRITRIFLDRPSITIIRNAAGKWNFSDLGSQGNPAGQKESKASSGMSGSDISIDQLEITNGQITSIEGRKKPSVYNDVNISVRNLSFATSFPFDLNASLPGGGQLKLEGQAGPLNRTDMIATPMNAALAVSNFNLVASGLSDPNSGLSGVADFSGTATSDGKLVKSKGYVTAEKLQFAKGGAPAGKSVWVEYSLNYSLAGQNGTLSDAKVQCGKAVAFLSGNYSFREDRLNLKMHLRGTNMPVQDLTALLPAFGVTLPRGASLEGGSLNADLTAEGPVNKLVTVGTANISKTRLVGFDLAGKMAALSALTGIQSGQQTEIEKFASAVRLTPEGIQVSQLQLIMPALGELSGAGNVAADQSLDFTMRALLKPSGGIGAGLTRLTKGGVLNVPFFVRGTASDPKFVPDTKNAARGLLGSAFSSQDSSSGQSGTGNAIGDALQNIFKKK